MRRCALVLMAAALSGCVSHERAQNPLPGVFRVAVMPFNNKTAGDIGLDTIDFTKIFASELQKIPTFEVVPVQEVLEVLGPDRPIETNQPELAYALGRALHAQAVIVGDVTEYKPYYPLRVGLHVEMYAMVTGEPEAVIQGPPRSPTEGLERFPGPLRALLAPFVAHRKGSHCGHCAGKGHSYFRHWGGKCPHCGSTEPEVSSPSKGSGPASAQPSAPGQPPAVPSPNPDAPSKIQKVSATEWTLSQLPPGGISADELPPPPIGEGPTGALPAESYPLSPTDMPQGGPTEPYPLPPWHSGMAMDYTVRVQDLARPRPVVEPWVIRHSRTFDANNLGLARKVRQYYFFKRDLRGGDWEGFVTRTDDFNRFVCDRMIYEMLEAAGGKWMVLKGLSFPHPWEPWPWR